MDEEKTQTEDKSTPEDPKKGSKSKADDIVERAREERERMEKATEAQRIENDRTEAIMARQALGGESEAGKEPEKLKEVDDKDYAEKALAGEFNKKDGTA